MISTNGSNQELISQLPQSFFLQNVDSIAKALIGKKLCFYGKEGIIVETESYCYKDQASHSFGNKQTKRNSPMFLEGGHSYVYLSYGMHYCLNIVTGKEGNGEAVLIRAILPLEKSSTEDQLLSPKLISGPGRVTKFLGINLSHNGINLINNSEFYLEDVQKQLSFITTTRIGISKNKEALRRFVCMKEHLLHL